MSSWPSILAVIVYAHNQYARDICENEIKCDSACDTKVYMTLK